MLSDKTINVYGDASVTLYCHIQPFNSNKCHTWFKESSDGTPDKVKYINFSYFKVYSFIILEKSKLVIVSVTSYAWLFYF